VLHYGASVPTNTRDGVQARQGAFISYARADGEAVARRIHARLQADAPDVPAWLDRFEVEGGVGWWTQIEQELDRAEFLILIMTPSATRSENTRSEWRSARQRGVCVYPVKGAPDRELGFENLPNWMRKAHFYDPDLEWEKLIAHLRRGCRATRVPFMAPRLSPTFVARTRETEEVLKLLLERATNGRGAITALRGPGGFGKTTLATAIAHDDRVVDAFDDGILWVTLGQTPNLLNELVKLYAAMTGTRPGFVDVEDAERELALVLEHKNCLIVIDDAWDAAHLRPFTRGGDGCSRLITTRSLDVAVDANRVEIEEMSAPEAVQLLTVRAAMTAAEDELLRPLVTRLGGWPLLIKLAGSAMRQRIERGETVANALGYLARALDKRGITAFDSERATRREDAVATTVSASFALLPQESQRRCAELAIFAEGAAVPINTAALLWSLDEFDAEDLARALDDLALVEFDLRRGTLRMHAVLRVYLGAQIHDVAAAHGRLIDGWADPYTLPDMYAWRSFAFHMRGAGRASPLRTLMLDYRWLDAKLRATDIHSVIADFEQVGTDRALTLVRDALRLSAPSLAADSSQLCAQLVARLQIRTEPEIVALREGARKATTRPWLELVHPSVDTPGGMLVATLVGHSREILALAADAGFLKVLSGSSDTTVRVWDTRDGQLLRVLEKHKLGVSALAISAAGDRAIVGSADGFMCLWNLDNGELLGRFARDAQGGIRAVALSASGGVAVSASRNRVVRVWDVKTRALLATLEGSEEEVTSIAISSDGTRAVSGSDDGTARVWNVMQGTLERVLEGHSAAINAVTLSSDGRHVLTGSADRTVKLWAADTGECLRTMSGHDASVTAVGLALDAWKAMSGASDLTARVWDLHDGSLVAHLCGHTDTVTAVAIDSTATHAASASVDRTIKIWRLDEAPRQVAADPQAGAVLSIAFSADGRTCASGSIDGRITVRDVDSWRTVRDINTQSGSVRSIAFSPDGSCVLSAGDDLGYWLWTIENGEGVWIPVRHSAPVDCYALSAITRYLVTACSDRIVYLWDVPSGALVDRFGTRRLFDHLIEPAPKRLTVSDEDDWRDRYLAGEAVYSVILLRLSDDGAYAVLSATRQNRGGNIREGSTARREAHGAACLLTMNVLTGEIWSVDVWQSEAVTAFAVEGENRLLLFARMDHAIELWNLAEDQRVRLMAGHTDKVNVIAFLRGATRAVSAGRDRTVRLWDLETGVQIAAFTVDAQVRALSVTPDQTRIAVGDMSGRTHLLKLNEPAAM
jgi:WD40 repeat protein